MNKLQFLKNATNDYRIGALTASSKYVIRKLVQELKHSSKHIIEYGAGDGAITKCILKHLSPNGKMVVIESNEKFIKELKKIEDKRLITVHDDVKIISSNLAKLNLPNIDTIISGIPFSFFDKETRKNIVLNTYNALAKGGKFIVYQNSPLLFPVLKKVFKRVHVSFEPRNFLPYFIMIAEKK